MYLEIPNHLTHTKTVKAVANMLACLVKQTWLSYLNIMFFLYFLFFWYGHDILLLRQTLKTAAVMGSKLKHDNKL